MTTNLSELKKLDNNFYYDFSSKEKESYNIAQLISAMAEYGYLEHMRVNGDKNGADIIFYRSSDCSALKIQLKGRLTFKKDYCHKELLVAYPTHENNKISWFVYDHDRLLDYVLKETDISNTASWSEKGSYSWPKTPGHVLQRIMKL